MRSLETRPRAGRRVRAEADCSEQGGWLQPQPFTAAIQQIGLWTIRLIFIALAITPLRRSVG